MADDGACVASLADVTQGYGQHLVLDGLNLALGPGVTALIGPNGAGKTTLLRTLTTLLPPKSGTLTLHGRTIDDAKSARAARRHIGFLPQSFGADPRFTVAEHVTYLGWMREVPRTRLPGAVDAAIEAVDLTDHASTAMRKLSGGMRQRAGIAGALVGDPGLVVLDEPTSGLDPAQRVGFRQLLARISGRSIVLSTHLIEDVAAVADRILLLSGGRIVFDGSRETLLAYGVPTEGMSRLENAYLRFLGLTETVQGSDRPGMPER